MEQINNFRKSLQFVLKWEGGYSEVPGDRGGATKWGITQASYDGWRTGKGYNCRPVALLTADEASDIYAEKYWDAVGCDAVDFPECTVVFDTAVNMGPGVARSLLQSTDTVQDYLDARKARYLAIIDRNPSQQKFLRGWLNRLNDLTKFVQVNTPTDQSV